MVSYLTLTSMIAVCWRVLILVVVEDDLILNANKADGAIKMGLS